MSLRSLVTAGLVAAALCAAAPLMAVPAAANPFPPVVWKCYRNDVAAVLATDKIDEVGMRFLVRKPTADIKADCAVEQRKDDVVLGEPLKPNDSPAYYYVTLSKSFLILDDGTGPDRALVIYDLPSGKQVLNTPYSVQGNCDPTTGCESEEFQIDETGLTFWRGLAEPASAKNCPKYAQFMKATGAAAIEEKVIFTFATRKVEPVKGRRCVGRQ